LRKQHSFISHHHRSGRPAAAAAAVLQAVVSNFGSKITKKEKISINEFNFLSFVYFFTFVIHKCALRACVLCVCLILIFINEYLHFSLT
jgi:hypothetical protein